ncbi:hypothetical protein GJU43_00055 [Flavobacterium sp. LC2016-23]|uniref:hypothetical protein n=1 Tax=Flavobacterium sp. LC2016-23 TaxID=2666330 RepID=UPI0012AEFEDB|nr:hypothetical protein [Flavobacterium sp. LC2016-23]MRX37655.1 hypothetical protein [Flavobacterium sp. LC2016-23]
MATEKISKELENRIADFLNTAIDPKDMAKTIRQVSYTLSLCAMTKNEIVLFGKSSIESNFYWLHRLAEVLDPYLDVD